MNNKFIIKGMHKDYEIEILDNCHFNVVGFSRYVFMIVLNSLIIKTKTSCGLGWMRKGKKKKIKDGKVTLLPDTGNQTTLRTEHFTRLVIKAFEEFNGTSKGDLCI